MMSSIGDGDLGFVGCMSGADRHQVVGILTNVDSMSLADARVETRLPTQDLQRARRWYADKLGLVPTEEREGGLRYECAAGIFCLFASAGTPDGTFTQMAFNVDDTDKPSPITDV